MTLPWTRKAMNLEERAYRTATMWSYGMRSFDAQDIFDYQNACAVKRDYDLYKRAKMEGLKNVHNPPVWLCRMLKREKGTPPALMQAIKSALTKKQLFMLAVMTAGRLTAPQAAKIFGLYDQNVVRKLLDRGVRRMADKMGVTRDEAKAILINLTKEDWEMAGVTIGTQ